ncbi:hypothetical protein [Lichenicola sp.]|uniref:hypothetical protein n=1 Tax=Lichenicola sp. TaxID=2804529 RepID=UPI003B006541
MQQASPDTDPMGHATKDSTTQDWALPGPFGIERWHRIGTRFSTLDTGRDTIALPTDAVTIERLAARTSGCAHPGPFPNAFRFCPDCGARLSDPPVGAAAELWSPPFGAPDGLPSLDERRLPDAATHQEIEAPASAALGFAVAGTPPMLLACDRASGWISAWSEVDRHWIRRVQISACLALPGWSWSASATARGLALPTDRGPAWIDLTRPLSAPVTMLGGAEPVGGAVLLRDHVALPVRVGGILALGLLDHAAAAPAWRTLPIQDGPPAGAGPLAAPVAAADLASWCGPTGHLTVQATADGPVARWRPWRDGLQPLPGVRPLMERNGTLHQLARLDPATLVLESLAAPGQVPERRVARGYAVGTGRAVFRENARLRLPWDQREAAEYLLPDDSFLAPLLAFDEDRYLLAVCDGRAGLAAFLGDPGAPDDPERLHSCVLHVSRGPRSLQPLDCVLRARHAWDLSVVIHAGWLLVHGAVENRLHRWRLHDAP